MPVVSIGEIPDVKLAMAPEEHTLRPPLRVPLADVAEARAALRDELAATL